MVRLWRRRLLKSESLRLGFAMQGLENALCQPSSKWVPFYDQRRIRQQKERGGPRLSSAVPKTQWDSCPHCPYGYSAMGNLYFFFNNENRAASSASIYSTAKTEWTKEIHSPL